MINIVSLLQPAPQPASAGQSAGGGTAAASGPVNLFAALIQKLLGNLRGNTAGTGAPQETLSGSGLPFTPASNAESAEAPLKSSSRGKSKDPILVVPVSQGLLMQLTTVPASGTGAAVVNPSTFGSGADTAPADGQSGAMTTSDPQGAVSSSPWPGTMLSSGQTVAFALPGLPDLFAAPAKGVPPPQSALPEEPASSGKTPGAPPAPEVDGDSLGEIFKNIVRSGNTPPSPAQKPVISPDPSSVKSDVPDLPGVIAGPATDPSVGGIAQVLKGDLQTDPSPSISVAGPGDTRSAAQTSQSQPAAPVLTVLETLSPGTIVSSVPIRPGAGGPVKGSGPLRRLSGDGQDTDGSAPADETAAPDASSGFFTGVIRNVIGVLTGNGAKTVRPDPDGDTAPPTAGIKSDERGNTPLPTVMDTQAVPAKKTQVEKPQDSPGAPLVDAAGHDQVDPSAFRSSQGSLGNPLSAEKPDGTASASPVRELPAPYAPLPAEVSAKIADQVVRNLKLQVDGTTSEIRMTLKPPSLGDVQLSVHVEDSKMQAQIDVSQQVVKSALEAHMPQLRAALQEHGIEVQRIDVTLPEQSLQREGAGTNGEKAGRRNGRRSLSDDEPESYQGAKDMGYNTIELIM